MKNTEFGLHLHGAMKGCTGIYTYIIHTIGLSTPNLFMLRAMKPFALKGEPTVEVLWGSKRLPIAFLGIFEIPRTKTVRGIYDCWCYIITRISFRVAASKLGLSQLLFCRV